MVKNSPKIYIICGEASGDFIASRLIKELKLRVTDIQVKGIGGDLSKEEGLISLFDYKDLAIMGLFEVLPKIPKILFRLKKTIKDILQFKPDLIITVDSPGFNFRIVQKLRKLGVKTPMIHYVAPTVWAYNPERATLVSKLYDHLLLILPFEKPYFDAVKLDSTFVGHPSIEKLETESCIERISKNEKWLVVMPGSRLQEIAQMKTIFIDTIHRLQAKYKEDLRIFIATLPHLAESLQTLFGDTATVVSDAAEKERVFYNADVALVKSGTSSVEMMFYDIPCVVLYKTSWLTYQIMRYKVKVPFISICNLVLNKMVMPEFIQNECKPSDIAISISNLLSTKKAKEIKNDYAQCKQALAVDGKLPSQIAADVIMKYLA
ncbi:MAG: lipid-A-disaccharide synthase [Alphaproteobacteria bacterium]|jgi:lipid-A-disaccharide synthase